MSFTVNQASSLVRLIIVDLGNTIFRITTHDFIWTYDLAIPVPQWHCHWSSERKIIASLCITVIATENLIIIPKVTMKIVLMDRG